VALKKTGNTPQLCRGEESKVAGQATSSALAELMFLCAEFTGKEKSQGLSSPLERKFPSSLEKEGKIIARNLAKKRFRNSSEWYRPDRLVVIHE